MLDLIIPVYNNLPGLYRSLMSIGTEVGNKIFVTIVDDCSTQSYDEVINLFQKFFPIRIIRQEINMGPGMARQAGLNLATQPYVSFLDAGDVYATPTKLLECLYDVQDNPSVVMFSWAHEEELYMNENENRFIYKTIPPTNNRFHGKIYLREFLIQHNIHFSEEGSRMNEDIGFNIPVRVIAEDMWLKDGIQRIYHGETPAVVWKVTGPSIVRADNCAFYYREQNVGMAINGKHILKLLKQNNVSNTLILRELYEEMMHMYMFYCTTNNARPEFLDTCLSGAVDYYVNCFRDHGEDDLNLLTSLVKNYLLSD